jgi:adenylate cyclase
VHRTATALEKLGSQATRSAIGSIGVSLSSADSVQATRLLLEDVCSDLARFVHGGEFRSRMNEVTIDREWRLGPSRFADLRIEPPADEPPYFLEVKYGYAPELVTHHISRKYAGITPQQAQDAGLVVVVVESAADIDEAAVRAAIPDFMKLEVWDHAHLTYLTQMHMGFEVGSFDPAELTTVRGRIDEAKERMAFGERPPADYMEASIRHALLWHFGDWRAAELAKRGTHEDPRDIVPAGTYENVIALFADISGFSRIVRETPDERVIRNALTNFYGKARYEVINSGGMFDQFIGDCIVALFGVPDRRPGFEKAAARTALRLLEIGESVALDWQRQLDSVQPDVGVHAAMSIGHAQLVPLRSLDPARLTAVGDSVNIAARLLADAKCGEVLVSNVLAQQLLDSGFKLTMVETMEAKNMGTLQPWKLEGTTRTR